MLFTTLLATALRKELANSCETETANSDFPNTLAGIMPCSKKADDNGDGTVNLQEFARI